MDPNSVPNSVPHALVIGCGYVGLPVAILLRHAGWRVTGWVYSETSARELTETHGLETMSGDVSDETVWKRVAPHTLVLHCASSNQGGEDAYQRVYLQGVRQILKHQPHARLIYVSSTSVYGQNDASWVDETSVAEPSTGTGFILREAEKVALEGGGVVLRSSGIYGPGRRVLLEKLRNGTALIEGDGGRWMNQIHRDDIVGAIRFFVDRPTLGEGQIFNVTDDEPVTQIEYYRELAKQMNLALPRSGPLNTQRKRGVTNKRIRNTKLRGLGWELRYPTFRGGMRGSEDVF